MVLNRFAVYAWAVLTYNIGVILWGAYVRATGSGAGCGAHWPTCNGAVVPRPESVEMLIEFSHRVTSGIALLSVVALLVWALRSHPSGHWVRRAALASMAFMVVEVLVGAVLVLFSLTATDTSVARAVVIALHLVNTFLLLAALALTAWWASGGPAPQPGWGGRRHWLFALTAVGMLVLGASGAVTALGDTLILAAGISPAESPLLATLVELRIYHPTLAILVSALVWLCVRSARVENAPRLLRQSGASLLALVALQLFLGALNVALQAPVWLQILHLLLSDAIWILFVLFQVQWLGLPGRLSPRSQPVHSLPQTGD